MKQPCPKKPGWTMEYLDRETVWAEKEYTKYQQFTPAERILMGEELRITCYGEDAINARLQGPAQLLERA